MTLVGTWYCLSCKYTKNPTDKEGNKVGEVAFEVDRYCPDCTTKLIWHESSTAKAPFEP
jgi:hypothetical protein